MDGREVVRALPTANLKKFSCFAGVSSLCSICQLVLRGTLISLIYFDLVFGLDNYL